MSAAKEAALLCRKAGSATMLLTVRPPCRGTRLAEKKTRTSGTVLGLGVCEAVGVCVGVCEGVAVREGEAERLTVVVAVGVGESDEVDVRLFVGVVDGLGVGVAVAEGLAVAEGEGDGRMHTADEPEPSSLKPALHTHDSVAPE